MHQSLHGGILPFLITVLGAACGVDADGDKKNPDAGAGNGGEGSANPTSSSSSSSSNGSSSGASMSSSSNSSGGQGGGPMDCAGLPLCDNFESGSLDTPTPDVDQQWIQSRPNWKPNLSDLKLGWESYSGQEMTLWFDDVALSSTRVGCN